MLGNSNCRTHQKKGNVGTTFMLKIQLLVQFKGIFDNLVYQLYMFFNNELFPEKVVNFFILIKCVYFGFGITKSIVVNLG